jgi:predicted enzyme related to lactoylglutathione lyase
MSTETNLGTTDTKLGTTESTGDPTINTVTWWEIPVTDLDVAQAFYGPVFGWTFAPFGEGYRAINGPDGRMIGGLMTGIDVSSAGGIRLYVNVEDITKTLAKVTEAGGTVVSPGQPIGGDMGWWGAFTAPDGQVIGLCSTGPAS